MSQQELILRHDADAALLQLLCLQSNASADCWTLGEISLGGVCVGGFVSQHVWYVAGIMKFWDTHVLGVPKAKEYELGGL